MLLLALTAVAYQPSAPCVGLQRARVGMSAAADPDQRWGAVLQGPSAPTRATVRRELVGGRLWAFEQVQGVIFVHIPVRMTVVKLDAGGLFAYAPVAPTRECLRLLSELEEAHGALSHILLPSLAIEHKGFARSFARARPGATLWVADAQYSYPLDLPLAALGFPPATRRLPREWSADAAPWAEELPWRTLGPLRERVGAFQEVAVLHRRSATLLVTDLIVAVGGGTPEVVEANDARALLFHARDTAGECVEDSAEARERGWRRIALFALYFQSAALDVASAPDGTLGGALAFARAAFPAEVPAAMRALGWRGFWPFTWDAEAAAAAFGRLSAGGRPLVPPILQVSVLNREPAATLAFASRVAEDFAFARIVPAHFDAPVAASPAEWLAAFDFLRPARAGAPEGEPGALPAADLAFLREFDESLVAAGAIRPPAV